MRHGWSLEMRNPSQAVSGGRAMVTANGYAGNMLKVDLSAGEAARIPTLDYAAKWVGGRGFAAKLYWDEVLPQVRALDPENRLLFMTGPLVGLPGLAGFR